MEQCQVWRFWKNGDTGWGQCSSQRTLEPTSNNVWERGYGIYIKKGFESSGGEVATRASAHDEPEIRIPWYLETNHFPGLDVGSFLQAQAPVSAPSLLPFQR